MLYFDLFNQNHLNQLPVSKVRYPRDYSYIKRLYTYNIDTIKNYYRNRNFFVKNTHILSRYLEHFSPHFDYDLYSYIDYIETRSDFLSKHFQFTSVIEKGIVHPPYFFGNDGQELILSNSQIENIHVKETQWKDLTSIKILRTHRDDTKLLLPLAKDDGSHSGLDSVMINPIDLVLSYRQFLRSQREQDSGDFDSLKSQFIIKYVLVNMLPDIVDFVLLNRVMNMFYGIENAEPSIHYRFKLFEPKKQLERYCSDVLNVITKSHLTLPMMLKNIPLVSAKDASELLSLPDLGYFRQIRWLFYITRIDYFLFLVDASAYLHSSQYYINDWKLLTTRLLQDTIPFSHMNTEFEQDLMSKMKRVLTL